MITTSCPASTSLSTTCEPMKPEPPVTATRIFFYLPTDPALRLSVPGLFSSAGRQCDHNARFLFRQTVQRCFQRLDHVTRVVLRHNRRGRQADVTGADVFGHRQRIAIDPR